MKKGVCPICGTENNCGMLKGVEHNDCWCTKVQFDKELFDFIPEVYNGVSCVCINCVNQFKKSRAIKKMYDLHLHTTASDGTTTPEEVAEMVLRKGMKGFAITDHDTIDGIKAGKEKAQELGLDFIPGIEFSSSIEGKDVHILGYYINTEDERFLEILRKINLKRDERNHKIIENLKKYKINLTMDELKKEAKGNIVSKLHMANVLVNKGLVYTKEEAFKSYLGKNGVAYEGHGSFTPYRAVEILAENGAFVSLAHPNVYSKNINEVEKLIVELKEKGLKGIEVQYPSYTKEERNQYLELAKKYDLVITGGSDFHGKNRANIEIGQEGISYSQMLYLKEKLNK